MGETVVQYRAAQSAELVLRPFSQFIYWMAFVACIIGICLIASTIQVSMSPREVAPPGTGPAFPPIGTVLWFLAAAIFTILGSLVALIYSVVRLSRRDISAETRWMAPTSIAYCTPALAAVVYLVIINMN